MSKLPMPKNIDSDDQRQLGKLLDFKEKKKKLLLFRSKEHVTSKKKQIGFCHKF